MGVHKPSCLIPKGIQFLLAVFPEFEEAFLPYAQAGDSIIYICFSTGIAGTFNAANIAKTNVLDIPLPKRLKSKALQSRGRYGLLWHIPLSKSIYH